MISGQKHILGGLAAAVLMSALQGSAAAATRLPIQGIVISKDATQNVACSLGICTATAADAVLNVAELHQMLSQSDVTVSTGTTAQDIDFAVNFKWVHHHTLTLAAQRSIEIDRSITVAGDGGLTLMTNDTGSVNGQLVFGNMGNIDFWSLWSPLTINGAAYMLVGDIGTLASDIAAHPHHNYALARSIGLSGFYSSTPITVELTGTFEGLGNTISGLQIFDMTGMADALFQSLGHNGTIRDLGLLNVSIKNANSNGFGRAAPLVGYSFGTVFGVYATGTAGCDDRFFDCIAGGLIAVNYGRINNSWSAVNIEAGEASQDGGLIGNNHGDITNCFATGSVAAFQGADEGGLIGYNIGRATISNSYATGAVSGDGADLGGLIGSSWEYANITSSYASGAVGGGVYNGGLIGYDVKPNHLSETYWDTTSSGIASASQGAGSPSNDPGVTGLSDAQLKSALPAGFSALIWAHKPAINGGLPYLIATPPQ